MKILICGNDEIVCDKLGYWTDDPEEASAARLAYTNAMWDGLIGFCHREGIEDPTIEHSFHRWNGSKRAGSLWHAWHTEWPHDIDQDLKIDLDIIEAHAMGVADQMLRKAIEIGAFMGRLEA
tara:strand:+ start:1054 stop:1419 length:366 start_codon:yes stop_codon:yes gene_type:complete